MTDSHRKTTEPLPEQLKPFDGWPSDPSPEEIAKLIKAREGKFSTD